MGNLQGTWGQAHCILAPNFSLELQVLKANCYWAFPFGYPTGGSSWKRPKLISSHLLHRTVTVLIFPFSLKNKSFLNQLGFNLESFASLYPTFNLSSVLHFDFCTVSHICPVFSIPRSNIMVHASYLVSHRPALVTVDLLQAHTSVSEPFQCPFNGYQVKRKPLNLGPSLTS